MIAEDYNYQLMNPGMASVTLAPFETIEGELNFEPHEVAAYDFAVPVVINHLGAPSPAPTPFPPTPAPSNKSIQHIINPRPQPVSVATPRKHVIATALRQPLQISHPRIEFCLPVSFHNMTKSIGGGATKTTMLVNNSLDKLKWGFDLRKVSKAMEDGIIKFLHESGVPFISDGTDYGIEGELDPGETMPITVVFCPNCLLSVFLLSATYPQLHVVSCDDQIVNSMSCLVMIVIVRVIMTDEPGIYECVVPVVINELWDTPYQFLHITGRLEEPRIWFDPPGICLTPVPLVTDVSCEFNVLASQYREPTTLTVETPSVECEDGSTISPLKVTFLQGNEVSQCSGDSGEIDPCCLPCKVTFCSPRPVSFTKPIIFQDSSGRSFTMVVTATADNCLLTCYPFLALHRVDHQIVREQDSIKGRKMLRAKEAAEGTAKPTNTCSEAIIVPVSSPTHATSRPSTSATSSNFQVSSSSYEHSASVTDSTGSTPGPRDGAMNKPPPTSSDFNSRNTHGQPEAASRLGSAMFPDEDSEEGIFHVEVLLAVQRWFSALGWPGGPFPINIPETLRSGISRKGSGDENGGRGAGNAKKDGKTIYDMIGHLSGRSVPGIPINSPLPSDPLERVKQIYWQHSTLLTFLKCQGACIASVRPEYLMTARDFVIWRQLQRQVREELWQQGKEEEAEKIHVDDEMEEEVFEAVSKRAWTDIMLQTLKALVLVKVTPRTYKMMQPVDKDDCLPSVNPDPLASNIYSVGERILLTWLNHYYERYRHRVWKNCKWGGVPPSRWVVNYDFDLLDGLVLAAVMGAYMPFLITSHLQDMYTHPTTAEQCLHNALKVVNAMRYAGIDYDVQAIDITDPNPIMMLLLVSHMYQLLPQYIPKATMDFTGTLHSTVTRQVKITNTSSKALTYQVLLAGRDARDFSVPRGSSLSMFSRQTIPLSVEFTSRFLRPAEATLVLIGSRQGSSIGNTLTFRLRTQVDNITPDLERVMLDVENPFNEGGRFRIVLVESSGDLLDPNKPTALIKPKEKKPRKVRSKTDHGQSQPGTPPSPQPARIVQELFKKKEDEAPKLSAFFSPMESVYLEPNGTTEVEVDFLPFSIGERQCSVIFLNEKVGEFLYQYTVCHDGDELDRCSTGGGVFGGDENVVYWKCEAGQMLKEKLLIPVTNMAKERALILAAQQHMSDLELERRHLTGTLMSCSVTAKTIKMLATDPDSVIKQAKSKVPGKGTSYVVEFDSDHFKLPEVLNMPSPLEGQLRGAPSNITVPKGVTLEDGVVELPVSFFAKSPGHYPCQIILRSMDDIRVYRIECTVNPEGSTAEMVFSAPVHQSITQEIPIVNVTNHDWMLTAKIEGEGFSGPTTLLAKAYQKTLYPLNYKAIMEREVKGKLVLHNADDGQDHVFHLVGKPEKPLSLGHIKLKIEAKKAVTHTFKVPNSTKKKLFYKSAPYTMTLLPKYRGHFSGVITFVATENPYVEVDSDGDEVPPDVEVKVMCLCVFSEVDSDGDEVPPDVEVKVMCLCVFSEVDSDGDEVPPDVEVKEYNGYRVWFSLEVMVLPAPPERVIPVLCTCQKKALLEVVVRNPTVQDITLTASITGRNLSGPDSISLAAGEKDVYTLVYAPAIIGKGKGSLVFFNELVGEFWYELDLEATSPAPTTLPHMECQLGNWLLSLIPPFHLTLQFKRENERPIQLRPHSTLEVPVRFMPSALGQADHMAKIIFHIVSGSVCTGVCQVQCVQLCQLGEWVFVASGTGLLPQPQDPVSVYTSSGTNTTLIIPFRNPMDMPILASITLKDIHHYCHPILQLCGHAHTGLHHAERYKTLDSPKSPFSMLLKNKTAARVGPKNTLDIPISFAPMEMLKYEALVTVVVTQEDGTPWPFMPTDRHGLPVSYSGSSGLHEIRWLFPIYGIPESSPIKESQAPVVECRARDTTEQQLEFTLAGVVSSAASQHKGENPKISLRDKTPSAGSRSSAPESVVVGETLATAEEFQFELACPTDDLKKVLPNCTQLKLLKQQRNTATGLVTLTFNFTYSPFKTMKYAEPFWFLNLFQRC
ncbi:hypothetical protein BaRGS_00029892 [Batillaria attramentaria]|uniref:Calponin-homology (CH) domain-containing protein n=1 Tax=Batillaria attramentaria TaxID=370345 RepID=A0ABD0JUZ9_9CAEN